MPNDLAVLFPEVDVKAKGVDMKIRPFGFGQLARVARYVRPIAKALMDSGLLTIVREEGSDISTISLESDFIPKLFQVLDEAAEPVMALVAFACGKERTWLDDLPPDEGILLTQKIWEVNSDFFVKRVLPMIGPSLIGSNSTGATSSPDSSPPTTGAETSTATP